jgi:hypothetical protein
MIQVFPADSRFNVDHGWLGSRLSFSFGNYYDPNNTGFGVWRVCNDDDVDPGKGFGAHPHRVNLTRLGKGDTARIQSFSHLSIMAGEDAYLMLIDLP